MTTCTVTGPSPLIRAVHVPLETPEIVVVRIMTECKHPAVSGVIGGCEIRICDDAHLDLDEWASVTIDGLPFGDAARFVNVDYGPYEVRVFLATFATMHRERAIYESPGRAAAR